MGVDSLMYGCSAGGSWRRGRARRNAALQRPGAGGDEVKAILTVVVGARGDEEEQEDWSQSSPQLAAVWCSLVRVCALLCCAADGTCLPFLVSGSKARSFLPLVLSSPTVSLSLPGYVPMHNSR